MSYFDSVFVAIAEHYLENLEQEINVSEQALLELKNDPEFDMAITHSTSHVQEVKSRLSLAHKYLFPINEKG